MEKFETNEEMIYSLIIDDLEQTISVADKQILEEWRRTTEVNEKIYQDFFHVQMNMDKLFDKHGFDPQMSWESLDRKIGTILPGDEEPHKVVGLNRGNKGLWYKIAAAVLLILSAGYYFLQNDRYEVVTNLDSASTSYMVLPDGTELSLNAGTTIKYDKENFNTERRLVLERGEVFVHVVRHNNIQFRIDLGDVEAQDIGTSFNVSKNDKHASVIVEEGKVAMKYRTNGGQVVLNPGMAGVYNSDTKQLSSMRNADLNYKSWVDKNFIFREQPFDEVAAQLQKVYKTRLIIKGEELKLRKLTAKLHYQTLDSVLEVISASLQCKVVKEQNTYVLSASQ
jgi:transmembrane sensor